MESLGLYKVVFENNKAVSAVQVDLSNHVTVEVEKLGDHRVFRSVIVYAACVPESIDTADNIVKYATAHH